MVGARITSELHRRTCAFKGCLVDKCGCPGSGIRVERNNSAISTRKALPFVGEKTSASGGVIFEVDLTAERAVPASLVKMPLAAVELSRNTVMPKPSSLWLINVALPARLNRRRSLHHRGYL